MNNLKNNLASNYIIKYVRDPKRISMKVEPQKWAEKYLIFLCLSLVFFSLMDLFSKTGLRMIDVLLDTQGYYFPYQTY